MGAVGDEDHLHAADTDRGAVAEGDLGRAEGLVAVPREAGDGDHGVDGRAGGGADFAAEAQREAGANAGVEAQADGDGVPDRAECGALGVAIDEFAQNGGVVRGGAAAGVVGGIGHDHGGDIGGDGGGDAVADIEIIGRGATTHGDEFLADLGCQPIRFGLVPIGDDEDAAGQFRHVGVGEAMPDGDGDDALLPLHRHHPIHEASHQRQRGGIRPDLPAIVHRHHRLDLLADGGEHMGQQFLRPIHHVGMGKLLVEDDDIAQRHSLHRQMTMRIELHSDHAVRPDDRPHPLGDIAFDVIIAVSHHGAVEAEEDAVERQGGFDLGEDFIAHGFVVGAVGGPRGGSGEAGAFDEGEALDGGAAAGDPERGGAHQGRRAGVFARAEEDALLVGFDRGRQGGEGVGFGGQRAGEDAHGSLPQK